MKSLLGLPTPKGNAEILILLVSAVGEAKGSDDVIMQPIDFAGVIIHHPYGKEKKKKVKKFSPDDMSPFLAIYAVYQTQPHSSENME